MSMVAKEGKMGSPRPADFPIIVCLCGSTRVSDNEFRRQHRLLTLEGKIVLSIGVLRHTEQLNEDTLAALDELQFRKIDLADEVLVLNVGGYIGGSTARDIEYAKATGKIVRFLEQA